MSVQTCCCDKEIGWVCKFHQEQNRLMTNYQAHEPIDENVSRFKQRLYAEQQMADTVAVGSDEELRLLVAANNQLRKDNVVLTRRIEELEEALAMAMSSAAPILKQQFHDIMRTVDARNDQIARIAAVLKKFYYAELSMSAVQPLLALCLELNPEIVEHKR